MLGQKTGPLREGLLSALIFATILAGMTLCRGLFRMAVPFPGQPPVGTRDLVGLPALVFVVVFGVVFGLQRLGIDFRRTRMPSVRFLAWTLFLLLCLAAVALAVYRYALAAPR